MPESTHPPEEMAGGHAECESVVPGIVMLSGAGDETSVIRLYARTYAALPTPEGRSAYYRGLSDRVADSDIFRGTLNELGVEEPAYADGKARWEAEDADLRQWKIRKQAEDRLLAYESQKFARRIIAEREAAERGSTWGRVDPQEALEAARNPREPEVGRFAQTAADPPLGVFYKGCVNEMHGESESGKTWLALHTVAQELAAEHVVAYVDYEDDEGSVYRRLKLLGVSEAVLLGDRFRYMGCR